MVFAEIPCLRDFRPEADGHGKSEDALFCTLVGAERAIAVALVWPAGAAPLDDGPGYGPELPRI